MAVMQLRSPDVVWWEYRGEGAANIVLAYRGSDPALMSKVLRLRKSDAHALQDGVVGPVLSEDERKLWAEWPDIANATSAAELAHAYARHVLCPLLGSEHVDPGILVYASREFLEAVNEKVAEKRPLWRREESGLHLVGTMALLVSDHSELPIITRSVQEKYPVISVEIKPKCGFLPEAGLLREHSLVKSAVPRFAIHQHMKLSQGKVGTKSMYSPLDLYSGSRARVLKALRALIETPQNNLAIFVNGMKVYGNALEADKGESAVSKLESILGASILATSGQQVQVLQGLVTDMLLHKDILKRLLAVQRRDCLDIEGCIHAYYTFLGKSCNICEAQKEETGTSSQVLDAERIHSLPRKDCEKLVRDYLISATAKDCGLMLTFQPLSDDGNDGDHHSILEFAPTKQKFRYKMFFLDLDLKPLKKLPYYFKLDQEIVKAYPLHHRHWSPGEV